MPFKLAVDYNAAKLLYIKGLQLTEIAKKLSIPILALKKTAVRQQWTKQKTETALSTSSIVTDNLKSSACKWVTKIDEFVNKALDRLNPDDLSLRDLERAVMIAKTADDMARRTYGLDSEHAKQQINLSVNVSGSSREHQVLGSVIDLPTQVEDTKDTQ